MTGHVMRVEWEGGSFPTYEVVCTEPADALCRVQFSCDCEVYGEVGIDENGPWHDTYVWEGPESDAERHRGEHGGDCTYELWLNNGDCSDELGHGRADIPVTFTWDGDGYEWHVAKEPDPDAELRDRLDAIDDATTERVLDHVLRAAPDRHRSLLREASLIDPDAVTDALRHEGAMP